MKVIKAITFLGNPGLQYEKTRHNIGWQFADATTDFKDLNWQKKFKGLYAQVNIQGNKFYCLKPQIFMNKSGESVVALLHFFKLQPQELLVVHDELEFDFGQVGFKKGGGLAGHNGLRSIASSLGTRDFYRFRLGISRPSHGNVSGYVLSKFNQEEQTFLTSYFEKAVVVFEYGLHKGMEAAEKTYSKKNVIPNY